MIYAFLKVYVRLAATFFFSKVIIEGEENIPADGGVLIIANHQNAFLDAILAAIYFPGSIYFLARGDVFRKKWAAYLLSIVHIFPVFRKRDGLKEPLKNFETFDSCYEILGKKGKVMIFPEANQEMFRKVRPLSKGFSRIVFGALEIHPNEKLYVLPLGINYEHYFDFHTALRLKIGAPIWVNPIAQNQDGTGAKAARQLKEQAENALKEVCVHIEPETEQLWFNSNQPSGEQLTDPEFFKNPAGTPPPTESGKRIKKGNFARFLHWPALFPVRLLNAKRVKDPHFKPSVKFALLLVTVPFYYGLILLVFGWMGYLPLALIFVALALLSIKLGW